ncbi:hypothetical protein DPEC_G00349400 [Dallia pectoralis]|uniref:Uncharacterized protein n=1 Tax=Dallia pectoralis TaxID=75939 RepID=A0ACC2F1E3_DALPE|nr:hypothetical protein DPEC_G00349400 [Dallia pectoralis]
MSWDLFIPEGQQGSGMIGGKKSWTPPFHLLGEKLNVGFTTRATLHRLLEAGDITPQEVQVSQQAALVFLVRAVEYEINKLYLNEALLKHAKCIDVQKRTECGVEDALYFVDRFQELLPFHGPEEHDKQRKLSSVGAQCL